MFETEEAENIFIDIIHTTEWHSVVCIISMKILSASSVQTNKKLKRMLRRLRVQPIRSSRNCSVMDTIKLDEELDLVNGIYDDFKTEDYLGGNIAPVFFGSALNNFGVKELLDTFIKIAPRTSKQRNNKWSC